MKSIDLLKEFYSKEYLLNSMKIILTQIFLEHPEDIVDYMEAIKYNRFTKDSAIVNAILGKYQDKINQLTP